MHSALKCVHLSCAIETGCDFFLTTDDGLLKKRDFMLQIAIMNPPEEIIKEGRKYAIEFRKIKGTI